MVDAMTARRSWIWCSAGARSKVVTSLVAMAFSPAGHAGGSTAQYENFNFVMELPSLRRVPAHAGSISGRRIKFRKDCAAAIVPEAADLAAVRTFAGGSRL